MIQPIWLDLGVVLRCVTGNLTAELSDTFPQLRSLPLPDPYVWFRTGVARHAFVRATFFIFPFGRGRSRGNHPSSSDAIAFRFQARLP